MPRYESVADHSWRVAVLSLLLLNNDDDTTDTTIDIGKCMQLAVVHDLAECLVGDIAPGDNISKQDKQRMETEAMEKIASKLRQATNIGDEQVSSESSSASSSLRAGERLQTFLMMLRW